MNIAYPSLEKDCEYCNGTGEHEDQRYDNGYVPKCNRCNGEGKIPNEFGEYVLEFLKKHISFGGGLKIN